MACASFFDARLDDVGYRAIVAQVDDLRTKLLQETPHDVDGSVVSVKERGCSDHAGTGLRRAGDASCVLRMRSNRATWSVPTVRGGQQEVQMPASPDDFKAALGRFASGVTAADTRRRGVRPR